VIVVALAVVVHLERHLDHQALYLQALTCNIATVTASLLLVLWVVMVLPLKTSMSESVPDGLCDCCSSVPKVMNAFLTTPPTIQRRMAWSIPTRISPNEIFQ